MIRSILRLFCFQWYRYYKELPQVYDIIKETSVHIAGFSVLAMGVQPMRWFKRDMWKTGIACAGILIFLILMLWIQIAAAHAYEGASGSATPGALTVQITPTEDATVTALNKEKLEQEVQQLKNQNGLDFFAWLRTNTPLLFSTLAVVFGVGVWIDEMHKTKSW
jgi:hypothetical protein